MAEKDVVITGLSVSYTGLFNYADLFRLIDAFLIDKGYDRKEAKHVETVKPEGKYIEIGLGPGKALSDYAKSNLSIGIKANGIKEVTATIDGVKQKLNSGTVTVTFEGVLETDYEGRWENKPFYLFLKILWDKYVIKTFTGGFEKIIKADIEQLRDQVKGYLNLERVRAPA